LKDDSENMKEEKTQEYIIESLEKLAYTMSDRAKFKCRKCISSYRAIIFC
jgi:hypothetical protein